MPLLKGGREPVEVLVEKDAGGKACALDEEDWKALEGLVDTLAGPPSESVERVIIICTSLSISHIHYQMLIRT